jgi:hypothetical protein
MDHHQRINLQARNITFECGPKNENRDYVVIVKK